MAKGNIFLLLGALSTLLTFLLFATYHYTFLFTAIGYPMLAISFGMLVIAVLSPNSLLHQTKIIEAEKIALLFFAIYLLQKPLDNITVSFLTQHHLLNVNSPLMFVATASVSLFGAWLLFTLVETPFLILRDRIYSHA